MDMFEYLASTYTHPIIFLWGVLGFIFSSVLFLITQPSPPSLFYLFLALMNLGFLTLRPMIFTGAEEESIDWKEDTDGGRISLFTIAGLVGLFAVSVFMSLASTKSVMSFWRSPAIWVPTGLFPLSTATSQAGGGIYNFMVDLFVTWFAVVSGEEGMKGMCMILFRTYDWTSWADKLPLAFQPAYLFGVILWAVEHVIIGQNPPVFALNVFFCGIIQGFATAQTGNYLTSWFIHALFNSTILLAVFLAGGYISVIIH